ncbi:methylated-DNA--protein-cysteine methyltransferase [Bradyrhizobium sp. SSBR45G]|uniref:methylated-DNA--[protein]-cysteine S-methyltransferase n=1 Tax=unclassified Bradyrhizobium TaxID=2631580 RepID=UPI002342A3AE|nr:MULTISPECIES: methylated-DNA--[protein]-cysteine S-methyltransferase [unclassified Bradyrhizobium]GLH78616.1 methylated-DNA--protein-cysteine methyltransferase [Bradyrhizobium sp. SSBR45G]GLH89736.1 methylated-DNA--protein-cysteine methyltransferase [Bradyrhizobium sp. SSBR45R]
MGRGYTIFDTALGRCGIAWSDVGITGVQLPEAREIETRRRLFRQFPEAREERPCSNVELAIKGISAMLRGQAVDFSDVVLDLGGVTPFNQRVYDCIRAIPRGETRGADELADELHVPKALTSITQALSRNALVLIVPCHRVRDIGNGLDKPSPNSGIISKRRLLALEGATPHAGFTLFDALLSADRPSAASRAR